MYKFSLLKNIIVLIKMCIENKKYKMRVENVTTKSPSTFQSCTGDGSKDIIEMIMKVIYQLIRTRYGCSGSVRI
jgi:hypothetical protein